MNPLIFLDIDGVLNSHVSIHERWWESENGQLSPHGNTTWPHPRHINCLNKIIEQTKADIVISSTWRIGRSVEDLQILAKEFGIIGNVIDKTRNLDTYRGLEIKEYILSHFEYKYPDRLEIPPFIAIDDDDDISSVIGGIHFVKTSFEYGLEQLEVDEAIQKLEFQIKAII